MKHECPITECLKYLSGAWAINILWSLRESPLRFGDLKRTLETVSPKVLTMRLRELESLGLILREVLPTSPPSVRYSLTSLGREFEPILDKFLEVGKKLQKK